MSDYESSNTAPSPNPEGIKVFRPKILGQVATIRQEISRFSTASIGLQVNVNGQPANVDAGSMSVEVYKRTDFAPGADSLGDQVTGPFEIANPDTGVYEFRLGSPVTQDLCLLSIKWVYRVQAEDYEFWDYYQVLDPMPTFDLLSDGERGIVRTVGYMFADLYDSVDGGPHLKEEFQTHFGTETIARCLELACNRINITSQPYTNYSVIGNGKQFPEKHYSVLIIGTYLEVIRHLIRSYTEQPTMSGGPGVAYLDRSNYADRWRQILADEKDDYDKAVRSFKRSLLGLGGGSLLVAGGIFGSAGGFWRSGAYAAQTRAARFGYPISYVVSYGRTF
jgi:hypothetical protein